MNYVNKTLGPDLRHSGDEIGKYKKHTFRRKKTGYCGEEFRFFIKIYFGHILKLKFSLKIRNNCLTQFTSLPEGVPKQLLDLRCLASWTTDRVVIILNTPVTNE